MKLSRSGGFRFVLLFLLVALDPALYAVGKATSTQVNGDQINFKAGKDRIRVQVCAPGILRVDFQPDGESSPATDTVDPGRSWGGGNADSITDGPDAVVIRTKKMLVNIAKSPFQVSVYDAAGSKPLLSQWGAEGLERSHLAFGFPVGANFYGLDGYENNGDASTGILRNQGGALETPKQGDCSGPFLWSTSGFGLLVDSDTGRFDVHAAEDVLSFDGSSRKDVEFYLFVGTPREMMASLHLVSGRPALFPKWAMGFTNSQWGSDEAEVKKIVATYRAKQIPIDNFTMDFDWKAWGDDDYGEWRWNAKKFPDGPSGSFAADMAAEGVHLTGILKPRIHTGTKAGRYASERGFWWPGEAPNKDYFSGKPVMDLNFSIPACRAWFFDHLKGAFDSGISGWWNDEADWQNTDLGEMPGMPGSMAYAAGVYTLRSSGTHIWANTDEFTYAYQKLAGDGTLTARVTDTDSGAQAGVMIRESLTNSSPFVGMLVMKQYGYELEWRERKGEAVKYAAGPAMRRVPDNWVRLERSGDDFVGFQSGDGLHWTKLCDRRIKFTTKTYAGLAVTSADNDNRLLCAVAMDHVQLPLTTALALADIGGYGGRWQFKNMQQSLYEGQRAYSDKRVWSINRSFVLGSQRYAYGMWSGDIHSGFASMAGQRQRMLSAIDLGETKWGMDSGGFFGTPDAENYARWIEFSAFVPTFRVHGTNGEKRQPWVYGAKAEAAAKKVMQLRYRLIPYIYSYEREAHEHGVGLVRPLIFDYPDDPRVANDVDAWMFGDSLLVAPVVDKGESVKNIYLPEGTWTDYFRGTRYQGGETVRYAVDPNTWADVPLFIRQGAIIASGDFVNYVGEKPLTVLRLDVFPAKSRTQFHYYDDDGETYGYEKGEYFEQDMSTQAGPDGFHFDVDAKTGSFDPSLRYFLVEFHGKTGTGVTINGKPCPQKTLDALDAAPGEAWAAGKDIYGPVTVVKIKAKDTKAIHVL